MPIFAAVLGHVLTNKRLTAALLASLAQLARARDGSLVRIRQEARLRRKDSLKNNKGGYQSGQMGQTVNLLAFAFGGSNPSPPTQ